MDMGVIHECLPFFIGISPLTMWGFGWTSRHIVAHPDKGKMQGVAVFFHGLHAASQCLVNWKTPVSPCSLGTLCLSVCSEPLSSSSALQVSVWWVILNSRPTAFPCLPGGVWVH